MQNAHMDAISVVAEAKLSAIELVATPSDHDDRLGPRIIPADLRAWLARLRLLELVPFAYLVPDSELLPPESIRFFHLDRSWTDCLVQGALSVGTVASSDRAQLERLHPLLRDELDEEERLVRLVGADPDADAPQGEAGPITGFLLRSRAVSAYPGLHVRAYRRDVVGDDEIVDENHPDRLRLLRLERLAPAVLLALFDGVPEVVHVEEPRVGVQFGVRLEPVGGDPNNLRAFVPVREAATGETTTQEVSVRFRPGSPGVLDLRGTANAFPDIALHDPPPGDGPGGAPEMDGAELALQMIRFPYRQVFGDPDGAVPPIEDVFRPSLGLEVTGLVTRFTEAEAG
jgi:hypothetical protein